VVRMLASLVLLLLGGYVIWLIALNLPGNHRAAPAVPAAPVASPSPAVARAAAVPSRGLIVPVAGVRPAQITDTFDDARSEGRVHDAIDIMAPRGTPVIAAAAGTVEKIFESERGGHTVYVRRDGGEWVDYYAHLDSYAPGLTEGQKIAQGQAIGTVGSTGDASADGPHLHFAVNSMAPGESWWQGKPVNPYPLLRQAR